ncbi:MAG TPA: alpha/beta hydrolase [Lachnospiraceae bacterium]|jgi:acetyl esterase/lipase|nr:alpha/beta hydrolase [Lachnospiraceae bacterium]HBI74616.1 alpha/beta hydrolase [Lachnospiraceae bacterium]HBY71782.1 alpha/beta hydrolase [Lachnospiraceae bacterium]HCA70317.1 alpha/beta hydrolase [Lachnospiraceae bacterium]HCM11976.1 alpha/beta hydrolase [Lachnospiraceae bacterium]
MEDRKYARETLEAIKKRQYWMREGDLNILIKPIPETDEPGLMDPRFYDSVAPMMKGVKGAMVKLAMKVGGKSRSSVEKGAKQMRNMMNGVKSIPIVGTVDVKEETVRYGAVEVPIRIYTPKQKPDALVPVFYYIHGGGFVAGSMDVVDEMCKLVVEITGCVAVQPEYRLAPEKPYPCGFDDCYAVLQWIYSHAEEFSGDHEKICISGDSAGGNLAAVCAMRDRDEKAHMVKAQALLYPTVDAAHMEENMKKAMEVYEISEKHAGVLKEMFGMMNGSLSKPTLSEYLGVKDGTIPYISPSLGNLEGLPPTLLLMGEYDFLRVENDLFAQKLKKAGTEVMYIRYRGISHGFADQVGIMPQAEDALQEIGAFMMEHLTK